MGPEAAPDGSGGGSEAADVGAVVPAAGAGRRMGGRRKQYLELSGVPVLLRSIRPFLERGDVAEVIVALPPDDVQAPPEWLIDAGHRVRVVAGGATRTESVRSGLKCLSPGSRIVAIHDGARPLLDARTLERCIRVARGGRAAVAGWPAVDTLKEVDAERRVVRTPDRRSLWHAQTPQVFPRDVIVSAYGSGPGEAPEATDDAALVERKGEPVQMVRGSPRNIKVTRPDDLRLAAALLRGREG